MAELKGQSEKPAWGTARRASESKSEASAEKEGGSEFNKRNGCALHHRLAARASGPHEHPDRTINGAKQEAMEYEREHHGSPTAPMSA